MYTLFLTFLLHASPHCMSVHGRIQLLNAIKLYFVRTFYHNRFVFAVNYYFHLEDAITCTSDLVVYYITEL